MNGAVWIRVTMKGKAVRNLDWKKRGTSSGGSWNAHLAGIPVGGPYTVEAEIRGKDRKPAERLSIRDILVGDIWIMAGQSNMEGNGALDHFPPRHRWVHMFAKRCEWVPAEEPTHWWLESPFPAHWYGMNGEQWKEALTKPQPVRDKGYSPGMAFGRKMADSTGVPIGLLPTALGGSNQEQWNPDGREKGTSTLYGSMLEYVRRSGAKSPAGILWYQGESETWMEALVQSFNDQFMKMVRCMRADLGNPRLPFIYVQLSRVCGMGVEGRLWNTVQEFHRKAAAIIPDSACVAAVDLPLDDGIHISAHGQDILGARLATPALRLVFGRKVSDGPQFAGAQLEGTEKKTLRVRFTGVNGRMHPGRHIAGFSVCDSEGKDLCSIYEVRTDPRQADSVLLLLDATPPSGAQLWYGKGTNPYCNLVDGENMSALVFGPVGIN